MSTRVRSVSKFTGVYIAAVLSLSACGGGGGGAAEVTATSSTLRISGVVMDGAIQGAQVFLDLNDNQAHDSGESISQPTDSEGAFTLVAERLSHAQAAMAMLVTHVPDTARDADDRGLDLRAAGRRGFTLMTPASAYVQVAANGDNTVSAPLLSPLTTLVAAEMSFNRRTLDDAKASVRQQLGLQSKDPMTNFVVAQDRALGEMARAVAITLGFTGKSISDAARSGGGQSAREHVAATIESLKSQLPSLLANVDLSGTAPFPVSVGSVLAQLSDAVRVSAAVDAITSTGSGSPNLLLNSGSPSTSAPTTTAPTVTSVSTPTTTAPTVTSVSALTTSGALELNGWRATVMVTVKDATGAAVPGAVVTGSFTVGGSSVSCTTAVSGACSITSGSISSSTLQTTFNVTGVTGTNLSYDASKNAASSTTIGKP